MEKNNLPKLPFSVGDRAAFIRKANVAVKVVMVPTVECVTYSIAYNRVEIIRIPVSEIVPDHNTRRQYYVDGEHISGGTAAQAKNHLAWLRDQALRCGATPDAIRLLGAVKPFSKKEEKEMAEKLKSQKSAAKPDKEALKSAATKAPVGKGKNTAPKSKGNAAALAAARAAKGPDTRKITTLKKPKDITAREGSARHKMLTDLLASKTVQEFRDKGSYTAGDLRYAESAGYIKLAAK